MIHGPVIDGFATIEYPALTDAQWTSFAAMAKLGYWLANRYMDGVINVRKGDVMCFIRTDGEIKPPRTVSTMLAHVELLNANLIAR